MRSSVKPSGVGLTTLVEDELKNTVFSGFLLRFRDNGVLQHSFKQFCYHNPQFRSQVIANSTVSANTNVNQGALKRLRLAFPVSHSEQSAIAEVLSDMDDEIAALEVKREKMHALKQGMMQELLTGRIRLT